MLYITYFLLFGIPQKNHFVTTIYKGNEDKPRKN